VEQHGYQSSDPEDYMELDLFGAPHQDALASDEVSAAAIMPGGYHHP
jgi:hypothetical protein